jgi:hypothetical protein
MASIPAIPDNISTENSGQLTLEIPRVHGTTPRNEKASRGKPKSLEGFTLKTFGWHSFMAISRRLVLF